MKGRCSFSGIACGAIQNKGTGQTQDHLKIPSANPSCRTIELEITEPFYQYGKQVQIQLVLARVASKANTIKQNLGVDNFDMGQNLLVPKNDWFIKFSTNVHTYVRTYVRRWVGR